MRVAIPHLLVSNQEIEAPEPGVVLRGLGLRLQDYTGAIEAPKRQQVIRGRVTWLHDNAAEEVFEMAVDTGRWSVLAREDHHTRRALRLAVGARVALTGRLVAVPAHDYLTSTPDVRSDWLVASAVQNDETLEWHADVDWVA